MEKRVILSYTDDVPTYFEKERIFKNMYLKTGGLFFGNDVITSITKEEIINFDLMDKLSNSSESFFNIIKEGFDLYDEILDDVKSGVIATNGLVLLLDILYNIRKCKNSTCLYICNIARFHVALRKHFIRFLMYNTSFKKIYIYDDYSSSMNLDDVELVKLEYIKNRPEKFM
jgi:hypothetical protein